MGGPRLPVALAREEAMAPHRVHHALVVLREVRVRVAHEETAEVPEGSARTRAAAEAVPRREAPRRESPPGCGHRH